MEVDEIIARLKAYQKKACQECYHPDSGTYCINKCRLPETYEEAIEAVKRSKDNAI